MGLNGNLKISNEDVEKIRKFKAIMDRGFYASGQEVTDLHNKVLGTRLASTNCSSCIRQRISALADALNKFESMIALDSVKETEVDNTPQDENKAATEAGNDEIKARMAKVRAARKNNKK